MLAVEICTTGAGGAHWRPFVFFGETHNFSMARCWERPRLVDKKFGEIFPIFRKRSRTPHDVFDSAAAIVTLGFFLLLAQGSRQAIFVSLQSDEDQGDAAFYP